MPEIGATLRETRLRRKIDITEVEAQTKIRARYLRALEDEEWDVLPGPTFVKTFLRTYAEYLGLDARSLVEEYRRRYEKVSTADLTPFAPGRGGRRERRRRPLVPPVVMIALGVIALLAALWGLGKWGADDAGSGGSMSSNPGGQERPTSSSGTSAERERAARERRARRQAAARRRQAVSLTLVATGPVYVCLVDASGTPRVDQETLQAGQRRGPFRSRRFRVTFGTNAVYMRVNGRRVDVPPSANPIGYELRPGRSPRTLSAAERPTCQ